jgi:hypothetical protein
MIRINFYATGNSSTVTPAEAGAQYTVWLRNEGLGPGLRRGDEDLEVTSFNLVNPSIYLPFQAKTPQTAIQMRGFKS